MAQLICRLPGDGLPPVEQARTAGISAWLVSGMLQANGKLALNAPASWLDAPGGHLPFCLEWHMTHSLTPRQENGVAQQLSPWLNHPNYVRWRGRTPLWLRDPEQLSHPTLASKRLRLLLPAQAAFCGGGKLGSGLDGRYERPKKDLGCRRVNREQENYESFLYHAHHHVEADLQTDAGCEVVVPAVLPLSAMEEVRYSNANALNYGEWLAQARAWADLWHGSDAEAWVLVEQWDGHHRWHSPASTTAPAALEPTGTAIAEQRQWTGWGHFDPSQPALLMHGFHLDLLRSQLGELLDELKREQLGVPCLYVSTPLDQLEAARALLIGQGWPSVEIVGVTNRGRDIAPFVRELLPRALKQGHPWFVKLHTKRSEHLGDGQAWGEHLRQQLGTATGLRTIATRFAEQPRLGLLAPAGTLLPSSVSLHHNASHLQALLPQLHMSSRWLLQKPFVAGSMFAARPEALAPLCELPLPLHAFEPEQHQRDGTLAHALERLVAAVAIQQGWQVQESAGSGASVPQFGHGWAAPIS